ncbi:hypothetical protein ACFO0A_11495 [Novosphingobium tardum]|uniref:Uncharacterized protein n=1 Tax=Novosphingobium tardum TaxID=1538021 RepID=A0ABV8RQM5_9SPHN
MPSLTVFLMPLAAAAAAPAPAVPWWAGEATAIEQVWPARATSEDAPDGAEWEWSLTQPVPGLFAVDPAGSDVWRSIVDGFSAPAQNQVRIEQRLVIRVAPVAPTRMRRLPDPPAFSIDDQYRERKVGRCVAVAGIAGVQIASDDRLLLFMRDQRLISAQLEKACSARDFYSGFYMERSEDGNLCVDRDMLQSRAGASCSLSRLRQLVAKDE